MPNNILLIGTGFIAETFAKLFNNTKNKITIAFNEHKMEETLGINQYPLSLGINEIIHKVRPEFIVFLHGRSVITENISFSDTCNENFIRISKILEDISKHKLSNKIKKILIIGSASEYGNSYHIPIKEDFELKPTTIYGLSKSILFRISSYYMSLETLPIVYVRQFNVAGFGQRDDFAISSFSKQIALIEKGNVPPIINVGNLNHERDFIDVRDVCTAYKLLLEKGMIGEVYNVGSGKFLSIHDVLGIALSLSIKVKEIEVKSNPNMFSNDFVLSTKLFADVTKISKLGFKPEFSITEMIEESLNYWRKS